MKGVVWARLPLPHNRRSKRAIYNQWQSFIPQKIPHKKFKLEIRQIQLIKNVVLCELPVLIPNSG